MADKQDAVEVVEDKKKNLKVMKMMCIYFLYIFTLSFSIISICLTLFQVGGGAKRHPFFKSSGICLRL